MNSSFHYIVRGIIRDGEHLLLCKQRNADYTFLLGGHIDMGEAAKAALAREIKEEIGADVTVGQFRGAIENAWDSQCEISLVFDVDAPELCKDNTPQPASSNEEHLEFLWVRTDELASHNLLPIPLLGWLQSDSHCRWGSTMNEA